MDTEPKRRRGAGKATCAFAGYEKMMTMRDEVLASVRDIEQLVQHGRDTHTCPYYSTRLAIPAAQVHKHTHTFVQTLPPKYEFFKSKKKDVSP